MSSYADSAAAFTRLVEIIARLRAPGGCPWDREQTHLSLRPHLIEEAFEVLQAIEQSDDRNLQEELGDLLMQPIMHAQIAAEENRFDIKDVINGIEDKLVRRHPHVFGNADVENSAQVLRNWDAIKKQEKAASEQKLGEGSTPFSALEAISTAQPALMLALEISKKAAKLGFEWPDAAGVVAKLHEEIDELQEAIEGGEKKRIEEELGDLLFTAVNIARWQKINPELALRDMTARFKQRFAHMENAARQKNLDLESLSPQQWEELWVEAKAQKSHA